jgi:hypothetical protein
VTDVLYFEYLNGKLTECGDRGECYRMTEAISPCPPVRSISAREWRWRARAGTRGRRGARRLGLRIDFVFNDFNATHYGDIIEICGQPLGVGMKTHPPGRPWEQREIQQWGVVYAKALERLPESIEQEVRQRLTRRLLDRVNDEYRKHLRYTATGPK